MGAGNQKLTPQEQLREHKRGIRKAVREVDRERTKLQQQEKKLVQEIKRMAKQNQIGPVRVMAKDLVRIRNQVTKFYSMKSQLQAVEIRLQTMRSTEAMSQALSGVAKSMASFNKSMQLPKINEMMKEFYKENQRMEMTQEMMDEGIDMAMDNEEDESQTEELVGQVLSEIGVDLAGELQGTPGRQVPVQEESKTPQVEDLEARFNALK